MDDGTQDDIGRVAALNDPLRRRLYEYITARRREVSRDEAAKELGIPRSLAAFHLDRLVAHGLLGTSFRRPPGRSGPGAGRPTKYYRRAERDVEVTIPPRRYELAAQLFACALDRADSTEARAALAETARTFGTVLGNEIHAIGGDVLAAAEDVLGAYGYEPERAPDGSIRLRNCPFHALAADHTALVCGMNLDLFRGIVEGMQEDGLVAELRPEPGMCCVVLRTQASE
ncbi:MAG TPA: helix-turn-helix domain-containing protein [Chloroflexota bacterium]|nr:helix-turn-helix domain-containing protein [Chloroflexota bacterium]